MARTEKKRDAHKRNYNGHYQPPVYTRDIKDSPELTQFGAFLASNKNEKKDALFESFFFGVIVVRETRYASVKHVKVLLFDTLVSFSL